MYAEHILRPFGQLPAQPGLIDTGPPESLLAQDRMEHLLLDKIGLPFQIDNRQGMEHAIELLVQPDHG